MDINCHKSGNKCISLAHAYTWYLLRINPSLTSTSWTSPPPPITAILINYLISKPLQNIPNLTLTRSTQYMSPIQLLYHICNHITPQSLLSIPKPFNSWQNYHMVRYFCEGSYYLSHFPWMPCFWWLNDTPGDNNKADRREKNISWVRLFNKIFILKTTGCKKNQKF